MNMRVAVSNMVFSLDTHARSGKSCNYTIWKRFSDAADLALRNACTHKHLYGAHLWKSDSAQTAKHLQKRILAKATSLLFLDEYTLSFLSPFRSSKGMLKRCCSR